MTGLFILMFSSVCLAQNKLNPISGLKDSDTLRIKVNQIDRGYLKDIIGNPEVKLKVTIGGKRYFLSNPEKKLLKTKTIHLNNQITKVNKTYDIPGATINKILREIKYDPDGYQLIFRILERDLIISHSTFAVDMINFDELDSRYIKLDMADDWKHLFSAPTTYLEADVEVKVIKD
jgi:hypothetical protein